MAGRDVVEFEVERYLDAVGAGLVGPRAARAAILDELRDGLHDAIATRVRHGEHPAAAVRAALAEFGAPSVMASGFVGELAGSRARRTVAAYLGSGPLVGMLWLLTLAPAGWWRHGPAALWGAIPPAPVIGLACVVGVLVLAGTGRGSRWLPLPPGQIVAGALIVVVVAVLGDLFMLARVAAAGPVASTTIAVLAVTASIIRLGFSIPVVAGCLRLRRTMLG
ncbi:permease prefix domain 1-containing protein [Pseudonocardia sp. GCM10023141]|uniref:permease prefix domain 1-containing protein n=1 Tax=Pseudonocardia sp. GCM10023141 TaxID=3252653 RepID=UPI00361178EA